MGRCNRRPQFLHTPKDSLHGLGRYKIVAKTMMEGTATLQVLQNLKSFTTFPTRVGNCTEQPDNLLNPQFTAEESKETSPPSKAEVL